MFKIGLSTCGSFVTEELFAKYQKAGIEFMEISVAPDKYALLDYAGMSALSKSYGVKLWSYHLPFGPFDVLDISKRELARGSIAYLAGLIKKGAAIGIDKFVIHPSGEPIPDGERAERMRISRESLCTLAEIAKKEGAVIAVEDLPRTCLGNCSDEIAMLIKDHGDLRVCFDTNHLLFEDPVNFIKSLGERIITVHVSDFDFVNERHWLPGEGKVDWNALIASLAAAGYKGPWLYEIGFGRPNTIIRERELTCEDFTENAKALFEGRTPPVLSKPKPNLGLWG